MCLFNYTNNKYSPSRNLKKKAREKEKEINCNLLSDAFLSPVYICVYTELFFFSLSIFQATRNFNITSHALATLNFFSPGKIEKSTKKIVIHVHHQY